MVFAEHGGHKLKGKAVTERREPSKPKAGSPELPLCQELRIRSDGWAYCGKPAKWWFYGININGPLPLCGHHVRFYRKVLFHRVKEGK